MRAEAPIGFKGAQLGGALGSSMLCATPPPTRAARLLLVTLQLNYVVPHGSQHARPSHGSADVAEERGAKFWSREDRCTRLGHSIMKHKKTRGTCEG